MIKLFLTSSLGTNMKVNEERIPCIMDNSNNMIERLKSSLTNQNKLVIISSDPENVLLNDLYHHINTESFLLSGFSFNEIITIDKRNEKQAENMIKDADLIILSGGHVPTQNKWFKKINLKNILQKYNGVILGISAGSMNCADIVYSCPEHEGEAIDNHYERFISGLSLTDINILPHFDELKEEVLDGINVFQDIVLPDSNKRAFYTLNDGSFIEVSDEDVLFHGDCFKIENGQMKKMT